MVIRSSPRLQAGVAALLVVFLWATSYVLAKMAFQEIRPLSLAGLRYAGAGFLLFAAWYIRGASWPSGWGRREIVLVSLLGVIGIALAQGLLNLGLYLLPATTSSLVISFTIPALVLIFGHFALGEHPSRTQWLGGVIALFGVYLFFVPIHALSANPTGLIVMFCAGTAQAIAFVATRKVMRDRPGQTLPFTMTTMVVGGSLLLSVAFTVEGIPAVSPRLFVIVAWLAVVNTAVGFLIWNRTLQTLRAYENAIIYNTLPVQVALMAWAILGEGLSLQKGVSIVLVFIGTVLVQSNHNGDDG